MQASGIRSNNLALGFFLILPLIIGYALLSAIGEGTTFESLIVFFMMGIFAFTGAIAAHIYGIRPFTWWDGKFSTQDVILMLVSYLALLASVFLITSTVPGPWGIIIALIVGGLVLAAALFKSQNVLTVIFAHALYNITIIILASGVVGAVTLDAAKLGVPVFTFGSITPQDLAQQSLIQVAAVSTSEEMLKVAATLGIFIMLRTNIKVAMLIAVIAWAVLHSVVAYPIDISLASIGL